MTRNIVGLLGQTLRSRIAGGLEVNLGYYQSGRQAMHVHERPSLSVLVSGLGTDRSRRQDYLQPPFAAVFHPTTEAHANDIGPGGVIGFTLSFDDCWLDRHEMSARELGGHRILSASVPKRLRMLRALALAFSSEPTAAADLETLAVEALSDVANPKAKPAMETSMPRWLKRAEEYLRSEFCYAISLRTVAQHANVHPVYLARVFRTHFGCSVGDYLRGLRTLAAGECIVRSKTPLAIAAAANGFCDQPHLCRTLVKSLGISPRKLRKLIEPGLENPELRSMPNLFARKSRPGP
jgi:AraC family transcriptional regulator